jgi:hypothetical protein
MAPSSKDVSRFVFLKVSHGDVHDPRFAAYRCRLMTRFFYGVIFSRLACLGEKCSYSAT